MKIIKVHSVSIEYERVEESLFYLFWFLLNLQTYYTFREGNSIIVASFLSRKEVGT